VSILQRVIDDLGSADETRTMICDHCGDHFQADVFTIAESHITGTWCPICWFKMMGSEFGCAPNYPKDAPIAEQMQFNCDKCSDSKCRDEINEMSSKS